MTTLPSLVHDDESRLHPFPSGWYALGPSRDLPTGGVTSHTFCGREVVTFRTSDGRVHAVDAYCPHLGAHLGHHGSVQNDTLRCSFHGYCFDEHGVCVKSDHRKPPRARLDTWSIRDRNGWLLIWNDPCGREPWFEVPELDIDRWSSLRTFEATLRSHPQETSENSVDIEHFSMVHGYRDVKVVKPSVVDGPYLTACYQLVRPHPIRHLFSPITVRFTVHVWGLGYSQVDVEVPSLDQRFRLWVLSQPTDGEHIRFRIGTSVPETRPRWLGRPLAAFANRIALAGARSDVLDDFAIWEHKRHVTTPKLGSGDVFIGAYRRYCRQFYASDAVATL